MPGRYRSHTDPDHGERAAGGNDRKDASDQEVKTDITWHGERAAHFISNSMSQGAVLIDNEGIVRIKCDDDAQ